MVAPFSSNVVSRASFLAEEVIDESRNAVHSSAPSTSSGASSEWGPEGFRPSWGLPNPPPPHDEGIEWSSTTDTVYFPFIAH